MNGRRDPRDNSTGIVDVVSRYALSRHSRTASFVLRASPDEKAILASVMLRSSSAALDDVAVPRMMMSPATRDFRTRESSVYSRSSLSTSLFANTVPAAGASVLASCETVAGGRDHETMLPEGKMKASALPERR